MNEEQLRDVIRDRAYQLWQAAGSPPSDGVEFWLAAEREIDVIKNISDGVGKMFGVFGNIVNRLIASHDGP